MERHNRDRLIMDYLYTFASKLNACDAESARLFCMELFEKCPSDVRAAREKARMCLKRRREDYGDEYKFQVVWHFLMPEFEAERGPEDIAIDKKYEF